MNTKSKIKQEKFTFEFPLLTKEDISRGKGNFFFPIDLGKEKDFRIIVQTSKHYIESLFNDIQEIYGEEFKLPPKNIEIRHFSPKYQEKFEGVGSKYDQSFQILT